MKYLSSMFCVALLVGVALAEQPKTKEYNVLFIAIDDLNDWVGCLGGNQQAITPNLDRFAESGMVMNKAYCPGTVCGPSRSSLLTGKQSANTGLYGNGNNLKHSEVTKELETLPEYFGNRGYHTLSTGKIFHKHGDPKAPDGMDQGQWAFHEFFDAKGGNQGMAWEEEPKVEGIKSGGSRFAWGACNAPTEKTKDYASSKWAADQLDRDFDGKPFFMALGISKPHLPWFVPQEFFDMYPLDKIEQVKFRRDDLDDVLRADGKPLYKPTDRFLLADQTGMHKNAQRAYLACVSYADYCVGVVLDALAKSKYADNTIVMIWGDHGWYLSEKMHYGKTHLWEESCRVPFIVKVPSVTPPGVKCEGIVNLLDMYPTLVDLCGLPPNKDNDGRSFAKLLANPSMKWNEPTLTTYQYKNHSLTDGRYRYIWNGGKKGGGSEELYDHEIDPQEYTNLASNPEYKDVIKRFKKYLPEHNEPESPRNVHPKPKQR
ncbi:MAG: sulfatase-like hydrolase/transferase [Pontiella sp.]|nr:sulfatase-like hydrolase/transferase [Pontiella sp.]